MFESNRRTHANPMKRVTPDKKKVSISKRRVRIRSRKGQEGKERIVLECLAMTELEASYLRVVARNVHLNRNDPIQHERWPMTTVTEAGEIIIPHLGNIGALDWPMQYLSSLPLFKSDNFYLPYSASVYMHNGALTLWRLPVDFILLGRPAYPRDGNLCNWDYTNWKTSKRQMARHKLFYIDAIRQ